VAIAGRIINIKMKEARPDIYEENVEEADSLSPGRWPKH
jgi:hypothetical protein